MDAKEIAAECRRIEAEIVGGFYSHAMFSGLAKQVRLLAEGLAEKEPMHATESAPAPAKEGKGDALRTDTIAGFPLNSEFCRGCGAPLRRQNAWMMDGCPCNSPLGVNSTNGTRWRLLMDLQQEQSREIKKLRNSLPNATPAVAVDVKGLTRAATDAVPFDYREACAGAIRAYFAAHPPAAGNVVEVLQALRRNLSDRGVMIGTVEYVPSANAAALIESAIAKAKQEAKP